MAPNHFHWISLENSLDRIMIVSTGLQPIVHRPLTIVKKRETNQQLLDEIEEWKKNRKENLLQKCHSSAYVKLLDLLQATCYTKYLNSGTTSLKFNG